MPSYSPSAQAALLKAVRIFGSSSSLDDDVSVDRTPRLTRNRAQVNRVFDLDRSAESLEQLTSGFVLASILHELDREFDPSHLETSTSTTKYLTNKRNLQTVYKGLFRFIRRQIPELSCQAKKYDYHSMADNPDAQGMSQVDFPSRRSIFLNWDLANSSFQLLAVMISAAALGPENQKYIPRIQNNLDRDTQTEIMQILRIVQQDIAASKDDDDLDEAIDAVMEARDIDLIVEEQNAALRQQLEATKKNLSDYITRLEHLQLSHEELRYEKEKNDRELEVLRKATQDGASNAETVKMLEGQVHEQMEIIARYEETIHTHGKVKSQLEAEVQRLTQKSIQAEELRDQVTEWKHKAEDFEKKANTADRYKQKLESQQHLVKEVQNLQYERAELQEQLRSLMDDKDRYARTRKAEDELTKMITQSEQHLWDERNQKSQLIRDVASLEEELMRLKNQRSHDESFIQDLQEQLQQGGGAAPQSEPTAGLGLNLEDELNNAADDTQTNVPLELSRLRAENDLLRRTMGSTGDAAVVRRELDEEKSQRERLQQNFNEIFEKHAVAQSQIEALMENMTGEGLVKTIDQAMARGPLHPLSSSFYRTQAFSNLRTENVRVTDELEKARKRITELETLSGDQARELLTLRTDFSAVEKDSVEVLEQLKSTDKLVSNSLQDELARMREKYKFATSERDAQKSQLVEALLAKEQLRKDVAEGKDLQEAAAKDADVSEAVKKEGDKIEKLRARLVERNEVSEEAFFRNVSESGELSPEYWPPINTPRVIRSPAPPTPGNQTSSLPSFTPPDFVDPLVLPSLPSRTVAHDELALRSRPTVAQRNLTITAFGRMPPPVVMNRRPTSMRAMWRKMRGSVTLSQR